MIRIRFKRYIWMASCTSGLTHILTILRKKSRCNMKYRIKRINTNQHKKVTKSVTKWSNPECENMKILIKLLLSMTYNFIVFSMWVSPLVHDAIHIVWSVLFSDTLQSQLFRPRAKDKRTQEPGENSRKLIFVRRV